MALRRLVIAEAGSVPAVLETRRQAYAMLAAFPAHYVRALAERGVITAKSPETNDQPSAGLTVAHWAKANPEPVFVPTQTLPLLGW